MRILLALVLMVVVIIAMSISTITRKKFKDGSITSQESRKKHIGCLIAVGVAWLLYHVSLLFLL